MATEIISFNKEPPLPPIGLTGNASDETQSIQPPVEETGFSNLTNVEAQRIMSVLSEIHKKVMLASMLPEYTEKRVGNIFSGSLLIAITEHTKAEQKYKSLLTVRENLENTNQPTDQVNSELRDVARFLKYTTRNVYRLFSKSPTGVNKLRYLKVSKPPSVEKFEELLQEVRNLVHDRLKTTVEEEKAKQDQLSIIIAKEQKTTNEVKLLQEELDKARRERSNEISKRNDIIRKLKDDLKLIKNDAEETTKRLESRSKQKEDNDLSKFQEKENALMSEINNLRYTFSSNLKYNREEEEALRKKKFKIESEVENWITKYDQEMEEKQNEFEDISVIFAEEQSQLNELQTRFEAIKVEHEKIMEERRIAEELRKIELEEMRKQHKAATIIQSIFRGYKMRKDLKKKKFGKDKKKKKK